MAQYSRLSRVADINGHLIAERCERNVADFLRWGFVEAGGYRNVAVASPGTDDPYADEHLALVSKDGVADGRIWAAAFPDWIYEAGLGATVASGVYVDGTLYPTASTAGTYAHHLDFPRGIVAFDAAIPTTALVQAAYSWRYASVFTQGVPWFHDLVLGGQLDDTKVASLLDEYRLATPLVVVEAVPSIRARGYQLGSDALWAFQDVLCHVVCDRKEDRDRLCSAIALQGEKTLWFYDADAREAAGDFPLDALGSPRAGASTYPDVVASYPWQKARIVGVAGSDVDSKVPLYRGVVRLSIELIYKS